MKYKSLILIIPCATLALGPNAHGLSAGVNPETPSQILQCSKVTCPANIWQYAYLNTQDPSKCSSYKADECYSNGTDTFIFQPCNVCKTPYTKLASTFPDCGLTVFADYCGCKCDNCTNVSWQAYGTGYQRYTSKKCDCSGSTATCQSTYSYQCAAGYYGSSTNGTSGCTKCPTATGIYTDSARTTLASTTSTDGTTSVTGCNIPSGTYYDTTGTFTLTSKCSYKE